MRKKPLIFLAFSALILTSCSYNPFNEFTGINFSIGGGSLSVTQYDDRIIWERNEDCDYYEVYVTYPASSSSSKSSSSSSTKKTPVLVTEDCCATINSSWVGGKVKVVGYSLEGTSLEAKKICEKSISVVKKTSTKKKGTSSDPIVSKTINNNTTVSTVTTVTIASTVDEVYISNITGSHRIVFNPRANGNHVKVHLSNVNLIYSGGVPVIDYNGTNKNVNFYFDISGTNTLSMDPVTSSSMTVFSTISVPNAIFYSGDGSLTVTGGARKYSGVTGDEGYAIKTNKIVSFLNKDQVQLIGGKGGDGEKSYMGGAIGHLPINKDVKVQTAYKKTIGLKAGDGGKGGANANGGNAYSYSYLTNVAYKKYALSFYRIAEAVPGAAGSGGKQGTFITE